MRRLVLSVTAVLLLSAAPSFAHHSYGEFDQQHPVSIEGTIQQLVVGSPHTVVRVRTDDDVIYTLVWGNAQQLARWGIRTGTLHAGDRIIVTGAEMRDHSFHTMSLLTEIRRPSDGWRWVRANPDDMPVTAAPLPSGQTAPGSAPARR